jgi:integrase
MASIANDKGGRKRILFMDPAGSGKRKTIRLGKATRGQAEKFKDKVQSLIAAVITGTTDDEVSRWVAGLPDTAHEKLVAVGLAKSRQPAPVVPSKTLGDLYTAFFQTINVKPSTMVAYKQGADGLKEYFGESKPLNEITPLDAARWQQSLRDKGLAEATVAKRTIVAKQLFARAVDWEMIDKTPLKSLRSGSQTNKAREFYVSEEVSQRILTACPNAEWRAIFVLARYGGLRCPSEVLRLKWSDINFETNRIVVTSLKTARHKGHESRVTPLFPELRKPLLDLFAVAEEEWGRRISDPAHQGPPPSFGAQPVISAYRKSSANLRTQFGRILERASITPWPRLIHNLRATRANELCRLHPSHVASAWLGHSEEVANEHYRNVNEADFAKAVAVPAEKAAQIAAQQTGEQPGMGGKSAASADENQSEFPDHSEPCETMQLVGMGAPGFEPGTKGL